MKTRTQYTPDQAGIDAAELKQAHEGGWIAHQSNTHFNAEWLDGVYHYSVEYMPTEIMNDLPGDVILNPTENKIRQAMVKEYA